MLIMLLRDISKSLLTSPLLNNVAAGDNSASCCVGSAWGHAGSNHVNKNSCHCVSRIIKCLTVASCISGYCSVFGLIYINCLSVGRYLRGVKAK